MRKHRIPDVLYPGDVVLWDGAERLIVGEEGEFYEDVALYEGDDGEWCDGVPLEEVQQVLRRA